LLWNVGNDRYSEVDKTDNSRNYKVMNFGWKSEVFMKEEAKAVSRLGSIE